MEKSLVEMEREKLPEDIPLKCPQCGYTWEYGGGSPFFATCPQCRRNLKIRENRTDRKMAGTEQTKFKVEEIEERAEDQEIQDRAEELREENNYDIIEMVQDRKDKYAILYALMDDLGDGIKIEIEVDTNTGEKLRIAKEEGEKKILKVKEEDQLEEDNDGK